MAEDLQVLNPLEIRIVGCLAEKKALTPDVYPLTLGSLLAAANQKTARDPVMALEQADIRRGLGTLQQKGMVRQVFGSRVDRFEHLLAQNFSLTQSQVGLLALLMLRGPQTGHELLARSERLANFRSMEEVRDNLDLLISRRPPLVERLPRAPGQREERYVHLLGGPVEAVTVAPVERIPGREPDLEARVALLEEEVARLRAELERLTQGG